MLQFIPIFISIIISILFLQMNHPLAMGLTLLIQTFLICLITGSLAKTFWFSYILFLVFLGGMLVLFIYVTSLASNEMFSFSLTLAMWLLLLFLSFMLIFIIIDKMIINNIINNIEMNMITASTMFMPENSINLIKLYNFPTNYTTLLLINYLFLTLIIIVKISNNFYGPLRNKN
uniref:NADH dehydrogenase subunit 6 n=1 Tax=Dicranoptycha shandongensis TaxID=3102771 RepID=UPI002E78763C|nr:NADH dehydrogenase subunit 6 [Dicranoptycha shandongensis]WPO01004.1 NADH dehydrogenase subunit 6 [Dicranoptycha shandongensis]